MRNLSNPAFDGTLEEAARTAVAEHRYVPLVGVVVERPDTGECRTLKPMPDDARVSQPRPSVGDLVRVGGTPDRWMVTRVAQANHRTDGRIEIWDGHGRTLI